MFISYGKYQFTIINLKLIMAPLEHKIEGDTRNKSKTFCDLLWVLAALLKSDIDTIAVEFTY